MAMTPPDKPIRVLLVDDDQEDYLLTRDLFDDIPGSRYALEWVGAYEEAVEAICRDEHDIYLIDYRLGAKTGLDLMKQARSHGCSGPIILLTGQSGPEIDLAALQAGAADFLEKHRLDAVLLERALNYTLEQKRQEAELERKVKERTQQLELANRALRDADRRKDEFLAILAHELRNPLAPIRNAIEIMKLGVSPSANEQARQLLERQVANLVRLIDDLLDVSRIALGKLRLDPMIITLNEVITDAVETSRPLLEKNKLQFSVKMAPTPIKLLADRVRLAQVFSNLLNNAAKYTEAGGSVSLEVEQQGSHAEVRVRDTGVGIPETLLPHIFDLLTQVDGTLDRSQGGLGIGLALVHRLVEMHGGTTEAKSGGHNQGAEFVVRLPIAQ